MEACLKVLLAEASDKVEAELAVLLPAINESLGESRVFEAMRYSVFAGGKRLRPFLVMAVNSLLGGIKYENSAIRIAAAMEILHTYSLIHDDLPCMDDDDLRRGKPTCHIKYDEATAVLAGDALLTLCFEILSSEDTYPDAKVRCQLGQIVSKAAGANGMVGGQMLDIMADANNITPLNQEELTYLQRKKTGAMFTACCQVAGAINYADASTMQKLDTYARNIGLAFQMIDDVLDVTGSAEELGKTPGKDAASNKSTFVTLMGVDATMRQAKALCEQAQLQLKPFGKKAEDLHNLADYIINRKK